MAIQMRWGSSRRSGGPVSLIGKLWVSLFLLVFAVAGLAFLAFMGWSIVDSLSVYRWPSAEATVAASAIDEDRSRDKPYRFVIEYRYTVDGREYTADRFTRGGVYDSREYAEIQRLVEAHPAGSTLTVYHHPGDPSEAVIERPALGELAIIAVFGLIPLVFVGVGAGGLYFVWTRTDPGEGAAVSTAQLPAGARAPKFSARLGMLIFFGFFFVVGSIISTAVFILPVYHAWQAKSWDPVECTILHSRVRTHSSSDGGPTYSVDIEFEYEYAGRTYRSSRYDFSTGSSSGRGPKQAVVDAHPAGSTATAWVNPDRPERAVISRELSGAFWFVGIVLLFPLVGAGGLVGLWWTRGRTAAAGDGAPRAYEQPLARSAGSAGSSLGVPTTSPGADAPDRPAGPVTLKPDSSRLANFIGLAIVAVIGNTALWLFLVLPAWRDWRDDGSLGIFTLLAVVLAAVGLAVIAGAIYAGLRLFNPTVELTVNHDHLPVGTTLEFSWKLQGSVDRLQTFAIALEGREEAEYTAGTSRHTDRHVFARTVLVERRDRRDFPSGSASFDIPPRVVPSFRGGRNRIIWTLRATGDIAFWPNLNQSFRITLLPPEADRG